MKFSILSIFALLTAAVVAKHAASPPEIYWKSKLPNTPMPKFIKDLLHPTVNVGNSSGGSTTVDREMFENHRFNVYQTRYNFYGKCCFLTTTNKIQLHDNIPNATHLFYLEKDLKPGQRMKLPFRPTSNQSSFLPREVVKSISFSSSKMAEILNKFGVKPGSPNAKVMENTIETCEGSGIKGEEKCCATSLESMVDFVIFKLGKSVEAFSTEMTKETKEQEYRVMQGVKKVAEEKVVVCHQLGYAYAVFYCHKIEKTVAYTVPLEGADGSRMFAASVCHKDTLTWDPRHFAFLVLKVKPGSVPVCHFLTRNSVLWVPE